MSVSELYFEIDVDNIYQIEIDSLKDCNYALNDCKIFKIIQNNIRSINKNLDNFLVTVNQYIGVFDIIVLTETRNISNLRLGYMNNYMKLKDKT